MTEREIEKKLVAAVKAAGGIALKLSCQDFAGMPDRLVLMPNGCAGFVEVKRNGTPLRPLQQKRAEQLRELGFKVYTLDRIENIPQIISEIGGDAE